MDVFFPIGHRAISRVTLAVLLIDDLTGRQITGSNARAWIEKEKPPIKKNDGWFVFADLRPGCYEVNAEGGQFVSCITKVEIKEGSIQMMSIRLRPGRVYPVPSGCLRVEGRAEPGSKVTIINCNKASGFKLLSDCRSGDDKVSVFHPDGVRLDGRSFRLTGNDGSSELVFLSTASGTDCKNGCYQLSKPLKGDYSRIGSILMPAYSADTDETGKFFMILGAGASSGKLICESVGSVTATKTYDKIDTQCFRPDLTEK